MSVPVTVKLKREVVELADKMVRYGIAKSRSHAVNLMIEHGIKRMIEEVRFFEELYRGVEELKRSGFAISHGGLSKLLSEERLHR